MRHNIFYQAHRPLKLALLTLASDFDTEDRSQLTSTNDIAKLIEKVLLVFEEQTQCESTHILPLIFEYEPSIWNHYKSEHYKAMDRAGYLERMFKNIKSAEISIRHLIDPINEFVLFNYHHMDDEEEVLNEILWRYYNDRFLLQVQDKIACSWSHRVKNITRMLKTAAAA